MAIGELVIHGQNMEFNLFAGDDRDSILLMVGALSLFACLSRVF